MVTYQFDTIDGNRVEKNVAAAYRKMETAFKKATGYDLFISRGSVTNAEQTKIFLDRYVTAGNVNGRHVYDTRWYQGKLYYRISSAGTVAAPPTSNHEIDGPNGPRSIDIRDSGKDAGVTVRGSKRDQWMAAHAEDYDFENEGYNFAEAWHKTYRGKIGVYAVAPKPPAPASNPPHTTGKRPNPWGVVKTWSWSGVAAMLRKYYGYSGNNTPGPVMMKAFQKFLKAYGWYTGAIDGIYGDSTAKGHQRWLKSKYGYTGAIDAWMGAGSKAAHSKANTANWNAFPAYRR